MKISNDTLAILKNFASINSNVLIKPGNMVKTISPVKNVLVESHVTEDFPVEFGVWDLNKFELGQVLLCRSVFAYRAYQRHQSSRICD